MTSSIHEPLVVVASRWRIIPMLFYGCFHYQNGVASQLRFSNTAHRNDCRWMHRCVLLRFRGRICYNFVIYFVRCTPCFEQEAMNLPLFCVLFCILQLLVAASGIGLEYICLIYIAIPLSPVNGVHQNAGSGIALIWFRRGHNMNNNE